MRTSVDDDWRRAAACTGHDPELFFPIGNSGPAAAQTEAARQVCRGCPVRLTCLEWALRERVDDGVWGGLSDEERRSLRRQRRRRDAANVREQVAAAEIERARAASRRRTQEAARTLTRYNGFADSPPTR